MILKKVSLKKKWRYEYNTIEEMESHRNDMIAAKFNVEHYSQDKLVAIYSQTIEEITNEAVYTM